MRIFISIVLAFTFLQFSYANIRLSNTPDWTSDETNYNDYSTGGAFVDINGDFRLDFVCGNGNDMASNYDCVYYNTGTIFEKTASWRSSDNDYGAHIACGDLNKDGAMDMFIGNFWGGGVSYEDEIYFNTGAGLEKTPSWQSNIKNPTFGVCLIDYDGDGDLDIATASSNRYTSVKCPILIYRNDNGTIAKDPVWSSSETYYGMDIYAGDINNDGWLDLVVACDGQENMVFLNKGGYFATTPDWKSQDKHGTIRCVLGDVNNDGWLDLAVADNEQMTSDESKVRIYMNKNGTLEDTPSWESGGDARKYYSCVAFCDVDNDGDLDLASGGWWEPVVVFENINGVLPTTPSWSWQPSNKYDLVCETVVWGDIDGNGTKLITDKPSGDGVKHTYYLTHTPVYSLSEVRVDGKKCSKDDYCYDYKCGWLSFKVPPSQGDKNIEVDYKYSISCDLGVTNWASAQGNHLFLNQINICADDIVLRAFRDEDNIVINWSIGNETYSGYNLYRVKKTGSNGSAGSNSISEKVNDRPIVGKSPFSYIDENINDNDIYYKLTGLVGESEDYLAKTSISDEYKSSFNLVSIYPNPIYETAEVKYSVDGNLSELFLNVFDISGRLVDRVVLNNSQGDHFLFIDRNSMGLSSGVYLVQLTDGNLNLSKRIVVY
jgi:hypothetical protein